ncbi:hypothetical protein QDS29_003323, partial [Acinetobacter baumannii]
MRDYGKVSPHFWTGITGKKLRQTPEGLIVAMYLMTSPHANMLGLYYMPLLYIAHETGLGFEGVIYFGVFATLLGHTKCLGIFI